jgi:hypothetical protein
MVEKRVALMVALMVVKKVALMADWMVALLA